MISQSPISRVAISVIKRFIGILVPKIPINDCTNVIVPFEVTNVVVPFESTDVLAAFESTDVLVPFESTNVEIKCRT